MRELAKDVYLQLGFSGAASMRRAKGMALLPFEEKELFFSSLKLGSCFFPEQMESLSSSILH